LSWYVLICSPGCSRHPGRHKGLDFFQPLLAGLDDQHAVADGRLHVLLGISSAAAIDALMACMTWFGSAFFSSMMAGTMSAVLANESIQW